MKKIILPLFILFLLSGICYAEIGATAYTGDNLIATGEEPVYVMAYNNCGSTIEATSHLVVILDTSAITTSSQASNCVGTYFTTTTTPGDSRVFGVTEGKILDKAVGKVIVRGPAKVDLVSTNYSAYSAGATISTSVTAGLATSASAPDNTGQGASTAVIIGTLLAGSNDNYPPSANITINSQTTPLSGHSSEYDNNVWWAWIGKE